MQRHSLEAARELERALGDLMALLDAGGGDPSVLERAARACEGGFEALRAGYQRDGEGARAELTDTLRANAVALDLVGRRLEGVRQRLEHVRTARRALGAVREGAATGESCDVAG